MTDIPHIAFPFRFDANNRCVVVEQDSTEEITGCAHLIVRPVKGQFMENPEFGIEDHSFEELGLTLAQDIEDAISEHEPRALFVIEEDTTALDDLEAIARIRLQEDSDG